MTTSLIDSESLLAIDIGSVHTRASLFDVVEREYHFIATGTSPSTVIAPYHDAGEGIHRALLNLQEICGRRLLDDDGRLILPGAADGSGVDRLVFTYSAGPGLRVVVAGLLADVSLESAKRLAATIPGQVVESIDLNDNRSLEMQINAILKAQPDLIILSGGTEGGASRSVFQLVELITWVCQVLPQTLRPDVLYAGNRSLAKRIKEVLERWTHIKVAPNVRPGIGLENLGPAQRVLAQILTQIRADQIGGIGELAKVSSVRPVPTSHAFGRMVQFLSHIYNPQRGVMGVDMGANGTTIAAAVSGKLALNVLPIGMGSAISEVLKQDKLEDIIQWLPIQVNMDEVRDYLWQKQLYPNRIPATTETLAIEQSLIRYVLQFAVEQTLLNWPGLEMNFEPYIITGAALTHAPSPSSSMLMLLDGIQPVGITTFVLDQNGLMPSLGVAAEINSILPVQVLESGAFLNLGTVISPISSARFGVKILRVRVEYDDGNESRFEVKKGNLVTLPLQPGQGARIHLEALQRTIIDPYGKHRTASFKIVGGACGAVIDARGRPIVLPSDFSRRRDLLKRWKTSLVI